MSSKIFLLLLFITAGSVSYSQVDTSLIRDAKPAEDTTWSEDEDWGKWENNWDDEWKNWDDEFGRFHFKGRPTITITYGMGKLGRYDLGAKFAKPGSVELRLGYANERSVKKDSSLVDYSNKFFHAGNFTRDLGKTGTNEISSNNWRFGFGTVSGYGYKFGSAALIFNHGNSFDWTRMDVRNLPPLSTLLPAIGTLAMDIETLHKYNKSFRFGTSWYSNIQLRPFSQLAFDASFERSIIFERHMFWKWTGGIIVEAAGQVLVSEFVDEILDSSPYAAPIVNFLLKNALSYGVYELRKEKMNWPFETAAPIMNDQFKIGLTFVF